MVLDAPFCAGIIILPAVASLLARQIRHWLVPDPYEVIEQSLKSSPYVLGTERSHQSISHIRMTEDATFCRNSNEPMVHLLPDLGYSLTRFKSAQVIAL